MPRPERGVFDLAGPVGGVTVEGVCGCGGRFEWGLGTGEGLELEGAVAAGVFVSAPDLEEALSFAALCLDASWQA